MAFLWVRSSGVVASQERIRDCEPGNGSEWSMRGEGCDSARLMATHARKRQEYLPYARKGAKVLSSRHQAVGRG